MDCHKVEIFFPHFPPGREETFPIRVKMVFLFLTVEKHQSGKPRAVIANLVRVSQLDTLQEESRQYVMSYLLDQRIPIEGTPIAISSWIGYAGGPCSGA
jgi:hypothetical protein